MVEGFSYHARLLEKLKHLTPSCYLTGSKEQRINKADAALRKRIPV